MKKWSVPALVLAVLAFIAIGAAQDQNMPTGKAFIKNAAEINIGEIELGKLAEAKGHNQAIKDFGKRMVEDHTKAEDELQPVAKQEGVTLPTQPGSEGMSLHTQLSSASGAPFDRCTFGTCFQDTRAQSPISRMKSNRATTRRSSPMRKRCSPSFRTTFASRRM
jgi:predicted outer membrane protein